VLGKFQVAACKIVVSFTPSHNPELPEHIPPELLTLETAPTPDLITKTATTELPTLVVIV